MTILPTLYKKNSNESLQFWQIRVLETPNSGTLYDIETEYGQVGTDSPQITIDTISKGKNIGKANETSTFEQANAEALAKWQKQKKKGYVESIEAAEAEELDALIEGGIVPMLAHTFEKQGHKIKYPCYVQPKLDGIRCIAIVKNSKCTLWSRTRKQITSCPHIIAEIENTFKKDIVLDGELYSHKFKNNFEHIVHLVRQEEPDPQHEDVDYHIYDVVNNLPFRDRINQVAYYFIESDFNHIHLVDTYEISSESEVQPCFSDFKKSGYEGAMLRNALGFYVNKRSSDLIKVKEFDDDEFKVVDIEEGRGKLTGHVGSFVCEMTNGNRFLAKMSGDTEKLKEYFKDHSLWKGKILTVQYQGLTGANGVPRFPVGLRFRESE